MAWYVSNANKVTSLDVIAGLLDGRHDYNVIESQAVVAFTKQNDEPLANAMAMWLVMQEDSRAVRHGIKAMRKLVEANCYSAMFNLAIEILKGTVTEDVRQANAYIRRIIAECDSDPRLVGEAFNILGDSLRIGRGVLSNTDIAVSYYKEAANRGCGGAAFNVAMAYHGRIPGFSESVNLETAATWYRLAADNGHITAMTNLAVLHGFGQIENSDPQLAQSLLRRALAEGDPVAEKTLKMIELYTAYDKADTADNGFSSIKPGDFPSGALLPMDHPDNLRLISALAGKGPDEPMIAPVKMRIDEIRFTDEQLAKSEAEYDRMTKLFESDPDALIAHQVDHFTKGFLLNEVCRSRAAGDIPDKVYDLLLDRMRTAEGRIEIAEWVGKSLRQSDSGF